MGLAAVRSYNGQTEKKRECVLTESEQKTFGNRCPKGYQKVKLLGK